MLVGDIDFEGFPEGGDLWWVRWFDYGGASGGVTGAAMLRVVFSKLPGRPSLDDLPMLDAALGASRSEQRVARMQAGWLPLLPIGMVVQTGKVVGQLGATLRRFAFGSKTHRAHVELLRHPRSDPAAPWRTGGVPLRNGRQTARIGPGTGVLGDAAYPLHGVEDGRILSIRGIKARAEEHLILPCSEVFRVAFAPHRLLALALLGGPWADTAKDVLDTRGTKDVPAKGNVGQHWLLDAHEGLSGAHATVAANLWLNPAGRKAAGQIWPSILSLSRYGGIIEAGLPFGWDVFEIEVAGIALRTAQGNMAAEKWFGYEIVGLRWPDWPLGPSDRIELVPTRTRAGSEVTAPGGGLAKATSAVASQLTDGPVLALHDTDPEGGSEAVAVAAVKRHREPIQGRR